MSSQAKIVPGPPRLRTSGTINPSCVSAARHFLPRSDTSSFGERSVPRFPHCGVPTRTRFPAPPLTSPAESDPRGQSDRLLRLKDSDRRIAEMPRPHRENCFATRPQCAPAEKQGPAGWPDPGGVSSDR